MAKKRDKSIAIKVVELILAAFIAKGLGFVREMVLANYYGTSYVSDVLLQFKISPQLYLQCLVQRLRQVLYRCTLK